MTTQDKQLLLKDLCARLPYGVKVQYLTEGDKIYICNIDQVSIKSQCVGIAEIGHTVFTWRTIDRIKPYLRPMSSMTDKELATFLEIRGMNLNSEGLQSFREGQTAIVSTLPSYSRHVDWLNANHFDYRGLIPMGLANEAPEGMYN